MPSLESSLITLLESDSALTTACPGGFGLGTGAESDSYPVCEIVLPGGDFIQDTSPTHVELPEFTFNFYSDDLNGAIAAAEALTDLLDRKGDSISFDDGSFLAWQRLNTISYGQLSEHEDRYVASVSYAAQIDRTSPTV